MSTQSRLVHVGVALFKVGKLMEHREGQLEKLGKNPDVDDRWDRFLNKQIDLEKEAVGVIVLWWKQVNSKIGVFLPPSDPV